MTQDKHPLTKLSKRYHQLLLPIEKGENETDEYKNAVLRGEEPKYSLSFLMSSRDSLETVSTVAGDVDVLFLENREDFEHAMCALAYRCEPREIPSSMGASTISGLINWEKIYAHQDNLNDFLADKKNYLDTIIILSDGPYSDVDGSLFGFSEQEWKEKSLTIRKYHELTHFVAGKLYPQNKESIRDEIIADMNGIISAVGYYDTEMAKCFLGIQGDAYRIGGRLQNYTDKNSIEEVAMRANNLIKLFEKTAREYSGDNIFGLLNVIESNTIGINYLEGKL